MTVYVSDIMTTEIHTIDFYDGICKAERLMDRENIGCLPVMKNDKLVGIITSRDVRKSHPNRIVADAMTKKIISITPRASIWQAKQKLEKHKIERLLVIENNQLIGLITHSDLLLELGKHIDLLTGLHKSHYIYHQAAELLALESNISFIFIDINNFGYIDKKYGHTQGDIILKELGNILQKHLPPNACLCRFGGDEFVMVSTLDALESKNFAVKLLDIISTYSFYNNIRVTACAGIASSGPNTPNVQSPFSIIPQLINAASLASTKAKIEKLGVVIADIDLNQLLHQNDRTGALA